MTTYLYDSTLPKQRIRKIASWNITINSALLSSDAIVGSIPSIALMKSSHLKLHSGAGISSLSGILSHLQIYYSPSDTSCCNPEDQPLHAKQENSKFEFHFRSC